MRTLIKGGTIVTAEQEFVGDILVEDEVIRAMGTHLDEAADLVIDAQRKYVFPGGVDQHTHFSALCNVGDRDTAGYETTDSAIVGGTTTIVDFAPQDPDRGLLDSIDYRINVRAKDKACVDFALHAMVTYIMDSIFDEIEDFPRWGISSIKIFMAYNGSPLHVDDGTFFRILEKSRQVGATVFVHAENGEILNFLRSECVKKGQLTPPLPLRLPPALYRGGGSASGDLPGWPDRYTSIHCPYDLQGGHCRTAKGEGNWPASFW